MTCPNPRCAQQFVAPSAAAAKPRAPSAAATMPKARPPAPNSALSKLPPNIYASPAFLAGGGVAVFLYGLVLFAVLSNQKRNELAAAAAAAQETLVAQAAEPPAAIAEPLPTPAATPEPPKPAEPPKRTEPPTRSAPTTPPAPPPGPEEKKPAGPTAAPESAPTPAPAPAPTEPPKASPTPARTAVASLTPARTPAPTPTPKKNAEGSEVAGIGPWVDPDRDCRFRADADGLTITVPGNLHVNSLQLRKANAPRVLADVSGDFVAQVKVAGKIQPGSQPLEGFPFTFQGAGLLLWQDDGNYLRFERTALSSPDRPLSAQLLLETCRDGRPGKDTVIDFRDRPVILKLARRGSEIACSYCVDGKTWIPVKSLALGFSNRVGIGVSAANVSPKTFAARFEDFSLDSSAGKTGKPRKP